MDIQRIILQLAALVLAVIIHEVAHGWVAYRLGDPTAKWMGRLTLNPIPHIDPVGSVILPVFLALVHAPFLVGWAKPVPIQVGNLKKLPRDSILVSVAGVAANAIGFVAGALLLKLILLYPDLNSPSLVAVTLHGFAVFLLYFVTINIVLCLFNLIPVPPLDGGHLLADFLPHNLRISYLKIERFGFVIILLLLYTGIFDVLLGAIVTPVLDFILGG